MNAVEESIAQMYVTAYPGATVEKISSVSAGGSSRRYYRVGGSSGSAIVTVGEDHRENEAFVYLSRHFCSKGLRVPEVKIVSADGEMYVQSDIGNTSLFDRIRESESVDDVMPILVKTIRMLPDFQMLGAEGLDKSKLYPKESMDKRAVMWDLNYFKYDFLKATGVIIDEERLEDQFEVFAAMLLSDDDGEDAFMIRDFQSRNVMIKDGEPYLIDFQGGRLGPVYYDVASFLWQARAGFSHETRMVLVEEYIDSLRRYRQVEREKFVARLRLFVLFRTIQVLGAYGFRGYFERKAHFLASMTPAVENLRALLAEGCFDGLDYLCEVLQKVCALPRFNRETLDASSLTVKVFSFSYKKGIPEDDSGNGGGFVFDCRAIHNPGRYDRYRQLTGMDAPVVEFLSNEVEMTAFINDVFGLVDASVEKYMSRGFTSLQVSFGCTGGQHRSVYSAELLARHLSERYGVAVELCHREQGVVRKFERR